MIFLAAALVFAVAASATDHGGDSIAFMKADDLSTGKVVSSKARFVSSGQPDEPALSVIADAGFSAVVDLRAPYEDRGMDEQAIAERHGMVYVSLPIAGPDEVTFDNAAMLDQVLADHKGRIFLHCSSGNRAGALYALRENLLGASSDEALAVGKAAGLTRLESVVRERLAEK